MSECPLCKGDNFCAISNGKNPESCWCMKVQIPAQLLECAASDRETCICQTCVDEWNKKGC
ncbi:cysteine-rich CWC family protein [Fictibacillus sp. 18YEL24]|uniref:cysteine-rich CWC family protein n=1 Tax=Fictibacillus sp. 18YEL24 TaxID=2745875 RepID=UPI0018CD8ECB|nr:cysteine-rich CWC family protein [Fictibacillus sp. 18YEL24]